jgi:histidinol-phosphate aminotransferase
MAHQKFSRREFSSAIGKSLAAALAVPSLYAPLDATDRNPVPDGAIRLNFNENPYGPSPKAAAALAACGPLASRYPDEAAIALVSQIASRCGVARENVTLGCGSTEILHAVDVVFLTPEKNVVVADPTYEAVLDYSRVLHSNSVRIPLTPDHRHDLPKMVAACTANTGVLYICNPNNPTGTIVSHRELAAAAKDVPSTTLILVDEAYFDFVTDPAYSSAIDLIPQYPNLLVARTFSKVHGLAGMRLGYAVGAKEQIARIKPSLLQDNSNAAVLAAASASLNDHAGVVACRDRLIATRTWLCNGLSQHGYSFIPSHANFVMIDMAGDVQPIIDQLRAKNIVVGRRFPSTPNFIRVTIGTQPETEAFFSAIQQIAPAQKSKAA